MRGPRRGGRAKARRFCSAFVCLSVVALATACVSAPPRRGATSSPEAESPRVEAARRRQATALRSRFRVAEVTYPGRLQIVAFKLERRLELWGFSGQRGRYVQIASYPFLGTSGDLGPKRRSWDHQIPEGFYRVVALNPASLYHLSLKLDYPNASDRARGDPRDPGSDIFIHGDNVSDGCIPIGNRAIEQLYLAVLDSRAAGFQVRVAIFPCRFSESGCRAVLRREARGRPELAAFWSDLAEGFELFTKSGVPPRVTIESSGRYAYPAAARTAQGEVQAVRLAPP